jgi:hypothetical protein
MRNLLVGCVAGGVGLCLAVAAPRAEAMACTKGAICLAEKNAIPQPKCDPESCGTTCYTTFAPWTYRVGVCNQDGGAGTCNYEVRYKVRTAAGCSPNPCFSNLSYKYTDGGCTPTNYTACGY